MQLSAAVQEYAESSPVFDIAFRTTIAGFAGHVCADFSMCSPNDVLVTHLATSSITFQLHVADGQLAGGVAANIQEHVKGGHFGASLVANGLTDVAAIEKMVFGEVNAQDESPAPSASTTSETSIEDKIMGVKKTNMIPVLVGCGLFWALIVVICGAKHFLKGGQSGGGDTSSSQAQVLQEVTVDVATPEYAKVAADETAKVELDETSKDQA